MKKIVILIAIMVIIAGCKDKKIDSSSDEKFEKSFLAVKNSLSVEKEKMLEEAWQVIVLSAFSETGNIFEIMANPERPYEVERKIKDKLNGKTADEIIAESNRIIAERKEEERKMAIDLEEEERKRAIELQEHIINEIATTKESIFELEKKRAKAEQDKEYRRQFAIIQSQFSAKEDGYFSKNAYQIKLTVKNGTKHAISKVAFQCVFASPTRSVPWERGLIRHDIPGGLEPGEQATWDIGTYNFDDIPKGRDDIVLTVTPINIYSADGKPLFDFKFSQSDEMELKNLNQKLERLHEELEKNLVD